LNNINIFNKDLLRLKEARSNRDDFLVHEAGHIIDEKIACIKRNFDSVLELTRYDETLQAQADTYDLVKSSLALHWINDVLGLLEKIKFALKPDGLFIANFFGGECLKELKLAFLAADKNSISPRVSPFIIAEDAAKLLQAAGFALPVVDVEKITVSYEDAFALMRHLRKIGETNSLFKQRKNFAARGFMNKVNEIYLENFPDPDAKNEKRVIASFEIITMTGWKPHASQQRPARRGSARKNLGEAL
jgi:NADH dehydrogenase [ubiquinone] 1 alpha subcomplex assembly factor 5